MCGRYTLAGKPVDLEKHFKARLFEQTEFTMFNIAPTMVVPVIFDDKPEVFLPAKWGMLAPWAKSDDKSKRLLFNLRADSLLEKSFMKKLIQKRCIIVASGFYEWQVEGKEKKAFYIKPSHDHYFGFAGLWQEKVKHDGTTIRTCAIITTEPNTIMSKLHHRMPVILNQEDYIKWLTPETFNFNALMVSYTNEKMTAYQVSELVNKAINNTPENILPLALF